MAYVRRRRTDGVSQRASTLELFYDLVFVFAITQVSHLLLEHLTWAGAGEALIVLLAVWWSWNYTTWTTNELDTETIPVRLLLLALMLVSLLMSVAIPDAFGEHALLFAGSYVAIQVGRHAFLTFAVAAGPAIYLFAHALFGFRLTGTMSKRKLFGMLACVVVGFVGLLLPALVF